MMGLSEGAIRDMKFLFCGFLEGFRVLMNMSCTGVLVTTGLTLLFSDSDLITGVLVLWSYWMATRKGLAHAPGSYIILSLLEQATFILLQYRMSRAVALTLKVLFRSTA